MNSSANLSTTIERPTGLRAFFSGFASGSLNGALMMGVVFALGAVAAVIPPLAAFAPAVLSTSFLGTATFMSAATGIFGGLMNVKRSMSQPITEHHVQSVSPVLVPTAQQSVAIAPIITPDLTETADPATTKQWAAQTGRSSDTPSRVQQIIANGSLSDKDRASAILAARASAPGTPDMGL